MIDVAVRFSGVTKKYRHFTLDGIDLTLPNPRFCIHPTHGCLFFGRVGAAPQPPPPGLCA